MGAVGLEPTEVIDRGIYSPLQLPLCDTPQNGVGLLAKGLEPSTIRLQVGRSTS